MDIFYGETRRKSTSRSKSETEDVKLAKYKKCPRCELNYILEDEDFCEICKQELKGISCNVDVDEEDDAELCPICGINFLNEGEKMCEACAAARADEEKSLAIDDVEPDSWDEDDGVTEEDIAEDGDDMDISLEDLAEEEEEDDEEEKPFDEEAYDDDDFSDIPDDGGEDDDEDKDEEDDDF